MRYKIVVIHFGEIWLKGRNRSKFIARLEGNIKAALSKERYLRLEQDRDRLVLQLGASSNLPSICTALRGVFGISWFGPAVKVKTDKNTIIRTAKAMAGKKPVRVEAHRSEKETSFNSYELVSALIKESNRGKMNMERESERVLHISIKNDYTYLCIDKHEGAKGLPVGSSGRAVVLLSGGIDSPVASYFAMKRGLEPIYLHIHGFPKNTAPELSKIKSSVRLLCNHSGRSRLYLAPYHIFQGCSMGAKRYELVLFKRFIYGLAERIMLDEGADCIVTGESVGQVASQTVKNLEASSSGIDSLIIRPLIGMDKQEIVDIAKRIGTFDISARPYRDVCSITPRKAELSAKKDVVEELYKRLGIAEATGETVRKSSVVIVRPL